MNRLGNIVSNLIGTEDADDLMLEILQATSGTVTPVPDVGRFYVVDPQ